MSRLTDEQKHRLSARATGYGWFAVILLACAFWAVALVVTATPHGIAAMIAVFAVPYVLTVVAVAGSWRSIYRWAILFCLISWVEPAYLWAVLIPGATWVLWRSWWVESRPRWSKHAHVVGEPGDGHVDPPLEKAVLADKVDRTKNTPTPKRPRDRRKAR